MTTRTSTKHVTFAHSFKLSGMKNDEPPGTFSVETHSEDTGAFSVKGNHEVTVWIRICESPGINGALRMVKIDPNDLNKALKIDAKKGRHRTTTAPQKDR